MMPKPEVPIRSPHPHTRATRWQGVFHRCLVAWVAVVFALAGPAPAAASGASALDAFEPYLGTWKGLVNAEKGTWDVSRWERLLAGQAVRIRHSVAEGAYGGETFIVWDQKQESLVYYYFTTAGFYTHGTMSFDAEGRLHSREEIAGQANGVSEVRSMQERLPGGKIRVETKMLRNGTWDPPNEVIYERAEGAEVVLPKLAADAGSGRAPEIRSEATGGMTTVALRVHRMDAMVAFYSEAFGAHFREVDTSGLRSRFAELRGGITLKLVPLRDSPDFEDFPSHQLGFQVADVGAVIEIAKLHGGRQEGEILEFDGGRHAAVRDPDGNTIELYGPR